MRYLYTGPDAKKIDEHAMEVVGMPSLVLMERAAMTVAKLLLERESADARFLAVCGTGNNGGDGMAVARILHEMGYKACITIVGYPDSMSNEAKKQAEIAVGCHVPVIPLSSIKDNEFDVIIDAIFGIGLSRDVTDVYEQVIEDINSSDAIIYALDVPSGIHSGTGKVLGCAVKAETTVTFGVNKLGLILHPGNSYAGEVIIADIGFPKESVKSIKTPYHHFEPDDISKLLPARPDRSHKGNYGHVLIVAGSEQMGGAAYLSALGAYRMGAGMVKVISPIANRDFLMGRLPEVLFDEPESLVPLSREQVGEQVREQVASALPKGVARLLKVLKGEMSVLDMMMALKLGGRRNFLEKYLTPATELGLVEMTQPNSPRSPTQKYRLTPKGLAVKVGGK